jgi:hypothetical protein
MKKSISGIVLLTALCAWAQPGQIENRMKQNSQSITKDASIEFDEWKIEAFLGDPSVVSTFLTNNELLGGELEMNRHFNELLQVSMDRETVEMGNFEN